MPSTATALAVLLLLVGSSEGFQRRWGKGKGKGKAAAAPVSNEFGAVDCPKCMSAVMRLLVQHDRGCPSMPNGTLVASTDPKRVPTAFCQPLLPKKRACVAYSFGLDGSWDFDREMVKATCRVLSFDPLCCGGAHRIGPSHDFIPIGLHWYDGLTDSDDAAHPNTTFPVLTLNTIKSSYDDQKVDVLRLKVGTNHEWKVLKNLVNTGSLSEIRQLSLNLRMEDPSMWEEYKVVLNGVKGAGFRPFYVAKQVGATYLKVQEGSTSLYSAYEVSFGSDL